MNDTEKLQAVRKYIADCDFFGDELDPDDLWDIVGEKEAMLDLSV